MAWLEIDKEGLSQIVRQRGPEVLAFELVSNAFDADASSVIVKLEAQPGIPFATLLVADDSPTGFTDLSHAYTVFAPSERKGLPNRRGRFNLGEKMVLSLCKTAEIRTTTGSVVFGEDGSRKRSSYKTSVGSHFLGVVRMTRQELTKAIEQVKRIIPPFAATLTVNGEEIQKRIPIESVQATLPTILADGEGCLVRRMRKNWIEIYEPLPGEVGSIYELGIPIVETGDRFHVNVLQKVPLSLDRDNVSATYLRKIRGIVATATAELLTKDDAVEPWAQDALRSGSDISDDAVAAIVTGAHGERAVTYDPSDPEANGLSVSQGRPVVHGGSYDGETWRRIREVDGLLEPAGQVTPSPKPYDPNGRPEKLIPESEWSPGMSEVVDFAKWFGLGVMGKAPAVRICNEPTARFSANYGPGSLCLNVGRLGRKWFDSPDRAKIVDLLIHEYGHHYSLDHLSSKYHDALTMIGAKAVGLALSCPERFKFRA